MTAGSQNHPYRNGNRKMLWETDWWCGLFWTVCVFVYGEAALVWDRRIKPWGKDCWNTALVSSLPQYVGISFFYACDPELTLVQLSVNQGITEAYTCEQLMKNRRRLTLDSTSLLPSESLGLLKSYHSAASPWGTKDKSLIWVVSEWGEEWVWFSGAWVFLLLYFVFLSFFFF